MTILYDEPKLVQLTVDKAYLTWKRHPKDGKDHTYYLPMGSWVEVYGEVDPEHIDAYGGEKVYWARCMIATLTAEFGLKRDEFTEEYLA